MRNQAMAVALGVLTQQIADIAYRCIPRFTFALIVLVAVTACGGGASAPPPPPPPPAMYSIGGTVSGLDASQSVVLQLNGGNDLTVDTNAAFKFTTHVASGSAYAVTVIQSPAGKTCTVNGGAGTASADVTGVAVACLVDPSYSVGGTVSGLIGQGLELALQVVSGNYNCYSCTHFETIETIAVDRNGDFVFATQIRGGYLVAIPQQPQAPTQRCAVQNRLGGVLTANAVNVGIVCGEFAQVMNSTNKTISAFAIDAATGNMISANTVATGGLSPYSITGTPDKGHLYVGNSGSNDVSAFAVDATSGALAAVPGSPFAAGTTPRSLAVFSTITHPSELSGFYSHSRLYVANAGSDNLSAYEIDEKSGALAPLSPATYTTGTGPSAIAILPSFPQFLYVANAGGSNDISAFSMDTDSGSLTRLAGSPFASGHSVSSLAFGSAGTFLYAADASGGTAAIYGFSISPPDAPTPGALTSLGGFPLPLPSCTLIVADQTGTYLYATTGTDLLGYRIDALTGALTPLSGFPISVGASVQSVSIDPTNQFLYVANGGAGTVTRYTLDSATGALTLMSGSPFAVGTSADYIATF